MQRTASDVFVAAVGSRAMPGVIGIAAAALAALTLALGLLIFARADGSLELALPARAPLPPPNELRNVAAAVYGPTLRASSAFATPSYQHHPAFVVDQRRRPTPLEKW